MISQLQQSTRLSQKFCYTKKVLLHKKSVATQKIVAKNYSNIFMHVVKLTQAFDLRCVLLKSVNASNKRIANILTNNL